MLVKWCGHHISESTWEPLVNFGTCLSILEEYEIGEFLVLGVNEILLSDFTDSSDTESSSERKCSTCNQDIRLEPKSSGVISVPASPEPEPEPPKKKMKESKRKDIDLVKLKLSKDQDDSGCKKKSNADKIDLCRGLELERVMHSFSSGGNIVMFVRWKGRPGMDAVPMEDLEKAFPEKVLEYFQKINKRYD
ncbi:uncharacterized protein LOC110184141 [Drosophila serrata]|uniref:uncharacterized protein LOC110184141 n=1 Tax=Drosophila serrata TaxID=7274 RepID=UPI000A1D2374|nr:uncharacterized protein LOC110184141 [Drosophila serrata]